MNANEWIERYRIGVLEVDEQHGVLFQLLEDFEQATTSGSSLDHQAEVLEKLLAYVKFHFHAEEKLMSACGFPELKPHVLQHRELEGKIIEFVADFEQNPTDISVPLLNFLKDWLVNHIQIEDMKIASFLANTKPDKQS